LLILFAASLGLLVANSPLADSYFSFFNHPLSFTIGNSSHSLTVHQFINEILMSLFFYLVGLEIKRELTSGHLNSPKKALMPLIAALGGMALPALIYLVIAGRTDSHGWAIPVATDIALAIGLLAAIAKGAPSSLRSFLLALAVIDDIGAILIIAIFYASGVHPTLIAVLLGLATPRKTFGKSKSLIKSVERKLTPVVSFMVVPIFAFANSGIEITSPSIKAALGSPIAWGIFFGLIIGKPLGIFASALSASKAKVAQLPVGVGKLMMAATGSAAGIGFTVSIFIAQLAFDTTPERDLATLAVIAASAVSAALSSILFKIINKKSE
jgi:NhaA family Na+:H+ antiporter